MHCCSLLIHLQVPTVPHDPLLLKFCSHEIANRCLEPQAASVLVLGTFQATIAQPLAIVLIARNRLLFRHEISSDDIFPDPTGKLEVKFVLVVNSEDGGLGTIEDDHVSNLDTCLRGTGGNIDWREWGQKPLDRGRLLGYQLVFKCRFLMSIIEWFFAKRAYISNKTNIFSTVGAG